MVSAVEPLFLYLELPQFATILWFEDLGLQRRQQSGALERLVAAALGVVS